MKLFNSGFYWGHQCSWTLTPANSMHYAAILATIICLRQGLNVFRHKRPSNVANRQVRFYLCFRYIRRAVVVAQLVERSLPTPEVRGSNPVIGKKFYWTFYCQLYWEDEKKKKRPGLALFKITHIMSRMPWMLSLFRKAPKLLPKPEYCYVLRPCAERIIDLFYLGKNYNSFYFPPYKFFLKKIRLCKGNHLPDWSIRIN